MPVRRPRPVLYTVSLTDPVAHEISISMTVPAVPDRDDVDLVMPAWAPGSYMIRDFSRHVFDVVASDDKGHALHVQRVDKLRWRVVAAGVGFVVRYRVFAFEETVRTSFFDDRHAYWNGTSVFMFVDGLGDRPCQVSVQAPPGWRVSTALPQKKSAFQAANYDDLVDAPFEVGTHDVVRFGVDGTPFELALFGDTNADVSRLVDILKRVVRTTGRLFGGFPFDRYVFIVHALSARGGGLEHRASTTLDIAGLAFEDEKAYQRFAELAAHEFFHTWNVKRLRDRCLGPFDYTREAFTRLLWFHEGFTELMEGIILLRAGLVTAATYLEDLAEEWPRYANRPGRNVTPLDELSVEAWIKQYKPAENFTNRSVSYYEKGKWAAIVLEVELRKLTRGRRGVVDVFRTLWKQFGIRDVGFDSPDVEAAVDLVAGRSMASYFRRFIRGVEELPVPRLLATVGINVRIKHPGEGESDKLKARRQNAFTGLVFAAPLPGETRAIVRTVIPGSPAWKAGLTYGDELVAVNGGRVNAITASRRLQDGVPGTRVGLAFFRRDRLHTATVTVGTNRETTVNFSLQPSSPVAVRAIRRGWLGS